MRRPGLTDNSPRSPVLASLAVVLSLLGGGCDGTEAAQAPAPLEHDDAALEASCSQYPVDPRRSLTVTDLSVVEDPVRTQWTGAFADEDDGAWHFGRLMAEMRHSTTTPVQWMNTFWQKFRVEEVVNCMPVAPRRAGVDTLILGAWPKKDGVLDLTRAPFRLLAISFRFDLRDLNPITPGGKPVDPNDPDNPPIGGELRFVYALVNPATGAPRDFTIGLEYMLPATNVDQLKRWALRAQRLSTLPAGSAEYRTALRSLTRDVTRRGAGAAYIPNRPNGSYLLRIRTNDDRVLYNAVDAQTGELLGNEHQMREFRIPSLNPDALDHFYLEKTPHHGVNGSPRLGDYILENADRILENHYKIPQEYPARDPGVPADRKCGEGIHVFRGSVVRVDPTNSFWASPNLPLDSIRNRRLRHQFSLNTCNGCHGREAGNTTRFHVHPRLAGQEAALSDFVTGLGTPVSDPAGARDVDGSLIRRGFNDLNRRRVDLSDWLCTH